MVCVCVFSDSIQLYHRSIPKLDCIYTFDNNRCCLADDDDDVDEHDVDDPNDASTMGDRRRGAGSTSGPSHSRRNGSSGPGGNGPGGGTGTTTTSGIPDPYYPIALPIDTAFKAKYVFHHRRGKTFQERLYVFLEHPGGWLCFIYHFTV